MKPHKLEGTLGYAILTLMAVTVIVPFVSILFAAVQPAGSAVSGLAWPHEWHWENFTKAWTAAGFGGLIANSFVIALTVVPLTVVMSTLAGYALGSLRVRGGKLVFTFFLLGLTLPVELIVVPLYYDLRAIGLTNSYWGVILAETAVFLPFGVFWMRTHFESSPASLVEAAAIDDASPTRTLWSVLLPLARGPMATLAVLDFMWAWNQFLLVLVLIQDPTHRTATAGLGFFVGQYETNIPLLASGTLIVLLPICVVYLVFQREFVQGMLQGALKG